MVNVLIETEDSNPPLVTQDEIDKVSKDDYWFGAKEFDYAMGLFQQDIAGLKIELVYPKFGKFSPSRKEMDAYLYFFPTFRFSSFSEHHKLIGNRRGEQIHPSDNESDSKDDIDDGFDDLQIDSLEFKYAYRTFKGSSFAFIIPVNISEIHWITVWIPLDKVKLTKSKAYTTIITLNSIQPDADSWDFLEPLQLMLEAFFDRDVDMNIQCIIPYLQQDNSSSGPLTCFYMETIVNHYSEPDRKTDKLLNIFRAGYNESTMKKRIKSVRTRLSDYMRTFISPTVFRSKQEVINHLNGCFEKSFDFYYRNIVIHRYVSNEILKEYLKSTLSKSERFINFRDYFYFKPVASSFAPTKLVENYKSNSKFTLSEGLEIYENYFKKLFNITPKLCKQLGIKYKSSELFREPAVESLANKFQQKTNYNPSTGFFIQSSERNENGRNILLMPSQIPRIVVNELFKWEAVNVTDNVLKAYNSLDAKYKNITYAMIQGVAERCLYINHSSNQHNHHRIEVSIKSKRPGECLYLSCIHSSGSRDTDTVMLGDPYDETIKGGSTYILDEDFYENFERFKESFVLVCVDNTTRQLKHRLIREPKELLSIVKDWIELYDPKIIRCDDSFELFCIELKRLCVARQVVLVHGSRSAEEVREIESMLDEQGSVLENDTLLISLIDNFVRKISVANNAVESRIRNQLEGEFLSSKLL